MSQPKEKIDFKILDYERTGNEFVSFKLEDDAIVKVKVDLDRVGVATNYKNSDGTPHYVINTSVKITVIPNERKFSVEPDSIKGKTTAPPGQMFT